MDKDDLYWCRECGSYVEGRDLRLDHWEDHWENIFIIPHAAVEAHPLVAALRADRDRLREAVSTMWGSSDLAELAVMRGILEQRRASFSNRADDLAIRAIDALIASLAAGV